MKFAFTSLRLFGLAGYVLLLMPPSQPSENSSLYKPGGHDIDLNSFQMELNRRRYHGILNSYRHFLGSSTFNIPSSPVMMQSCRWVERVSDKPKKVWLVSVG